MRVPVPCQSKLRQKDASKESKNVTSIKSHDTEHAVVAASISPGLMTGEHRTYTRKPMAAFKTWRRLVAMARGTGALSLIERFSADRTSSSISIQLPVSGL